MVENGAGDCLVFHAMIVHGAPEQRTPGARRPGFAAHTGYDARYDRARHIPVFRQARLWQPARR